MRKTARWWIGVALAVFAALPSQAQKGAEAVVKTASELLEALDAYVEAAESRWESDFEGRLAKSGGTPLTEDEILRPVREARSRLERLRRDLESDDGAEAHEEAAMIAAELHWKLALEEARRHVEAIRAREGIVTYADAAARLVRERQGLVDRIGDLIDLAREHEREFSWEAWAELADATLDVRDGDEPASQLDDFLRAARVVHTDEETGAQEVFDMSALFVPLAIQYPDEEAITGPYPVGGRLDARKLYRVVGLALEETSTIEGRTRVLERLNEFHRGTRLPDPANDVRLLMVLGRDVAMQRSHQVRIEEDDPWMDYVVVMSSRVFTPSPYEDKQLPYQAFLEFLEAEAPSPDVVQTMLNYDRIAVLAIPAPGAMPGRRTFRVEGEEVHWTYGRSDDAPAAAGDLRLRRELPGGESAAVRSIFDGDRLFFEFELDREIEDTELDLSLAWIDEETERAQPFDWNGSSGVTLERIEDSKTLYRSRVLFAPTALTNQRRRDPLQQLNMPPQSTLLAALPDSTPILSAPLAAHFAEDPVRVGRSAWNLFQRACRTAGIDASTADVKPTQESGRVGSGPAFKGTKYDVVVMLGDHAAMLLVRDEMLRGLETQRGQLMQFLQEVVRDPELAERWIEVDLRAEVESGMRALGSLPIEVEGVDGETLGEVLKLLPEEGEARRTRVVRVARLVAQAMFDSIESAAQRCRDTKDADLEELIKLAGPGLDPLRRRFTPDLVERVRVGGELWWVPDRWVLPHVGTIEQLHLQLNDGEAYADASKDFWLAVAGLGALSAEVYAVRASLLALHRLATGLRGIALTLEVVGFRDSLFRKLPQAWEQSAEVEFARGTMGVLAHQRFDVAVAKQKPTWMLAVELSAGGLGMASEAVMLSRSIRLVDEATESKAYLRLLAADGLDAFRAMDTDVQARVVALLADASQGPALATPTLRHGTRLAAKQAIRRLEEDLQLRALDRWWDQDWFRGLRTDYDSSAPYAAQGTRAAEALQNRPEGWPDASGALFPLRSEAFGRVPRMHRLGERLAEGSAAAVHALEDDARLVAKLLKERDAARAREAIDLAKEAAAKLADGGIPHLGIVGQGNNGGITFMIQERMPEGARTLRFRETLKPDKSGYFLNGIQGYDPKGPMPRALQHAFLRLYQRLGRAGLVWEDGHIENIYFVRKGLGWEAGILDLDRIATFGGKIEDTSRAVWNALVYAGGGYSKVNSMRGAKNLGTGPWPNMLDAEFAMQKMLEYRSMISYDPKSGTWTGRLLDLDVVEQYFPGFRSHLGPRLPEIAAARGR